MVTASEETADQGARGGLERLAWWFDTPLGLVALFAVGLGIRLAIAPWEGFYLDLENAKVWAGALAQVGPHRFYSSVQFADYPPGYLYFLWVIGKISAAPSYFLLKMPALLGDIGVAAVAGVLARRIAPGALVERVPVRALVAAAVLFNPAIIFDSSLRVSSMGQSRLTRSISSVSTSLSSG